MEYLPTLGVVSGVKKTFQSGVFGIGTIQRPGVFITVRVPETNGWILIGQCPPKERRMSTQERLSTDKGALTSEAHLSVREEVLDSRYRFVSGSVDVSWILAYLYLKPSCAFLIDLVGQSQNQFISDGCFKKLGLEQLTTGWRPLVKTHFRPSQFL